jgi:hypothetical protein
MAETYIPNAGQTYMPFEENIHIPTLDYVPLSAPQPPLPELELSKKFIELGFETASQCQHFLPGITAGMLDWFWANMEKCYYLWAPGSHKRFNWVRPPWKYGITGSAHMISETVAQGAPVFGGSGIQIDRLELEWFPFTDSLEHVICEGVFNSKGELVDSTIHMWQDTPGGCVHQTASVINTRATMPPQFVLEMLEKDPGAQFVPPSATDHSEYEAAMWPKFLPVIYGLWKDHPDPTQSVPCNLKVLRDENGALRYVSDINKK